MASGDQAHAQVAVACRIVRDDPDVVGHRRERCELAIDDARATDGERRLVGAAEPPRAASGKDGRRDTSPTREVTTSEQ